MNEVLSAVPVIISLIVIEGLLSVDNAMAIAAMASGLPEHQRKKALKYGIIGAYVARGTCLMLAAWIASNLWIKAFGAAYLIYLMLAHLLGKEDDDSASGVAQRSFWGTVAAIEVMDLSLSLDNVVAAIALDRRMWVIITGVFIGILALRFVAVGCISLVEKFPVLKTTAFLLVGFVGCFLLAELALESLGSHYHLSSVVKFGGIFAITGLSLICGPRERTA